MSRRRRAILIESGNIAVAPQLPGAAQDVKNWMNYLQTPLGGCWNAEHEIIPMSHPTLEYLETELLKLSVCEYAFIAFSGHGGYNVNTSEDFIFLNNREIITVNRIIGLVKNIVDKTVIIVDACRDNKNPPDCFVYSDYREHAKNLLESVQIPEVVYNRDVLLEGDSLSSYCNSGSASTDAFSKKWWEILDSKPKGIVLLQSCSQGKTTTEGKDGVQQFGLFSRSMLDAAYRKSYSDALSLNDAFEFAKGQVSFNTKNGQIPEISYPGQDNQTPGNEYTCQYPFSVKVNMLKTYIDFYNNNNFNSIPKVFYDGKKMELEYQESNRILNEIESYRIDKPFTFTHIQNHASVFEMPDGEEKDLRAINVDGSRCSNLKYKMKPHEIEFFRKKGLKVPDTGEIEYRKIISSMFSNELIVLLY